MSCHTCEAGRRKGRRCGVRLKDGRWLTDARHAFEHLTGDRLHVRAGHVFARRLGDLCGLADRGGAESRTVELLGALDERRRVCPPYTPRIAAESRGSTLGSCRRGARLRLRQWLWWAA
jgi:hypothetical protein